MEAKGHIMRETVSLPYLEQACLDYRKGDIYIWHGLAPLLPVCITVQDHTVYHNTYQVQP